MQKGPRSGVNLGRGSQVWVKFGQEDQYGKNINMDLFKYGKKDPRAKLELERLLNRTKLVFFLPGRAFILLREERMTPRWH